MRRPLLWIFVLLAPSWGCESSRAFTCSQDEHCGADGRCDRTTSFCAFPDDTCSSGLRYGDHAGNGLAGVCTIPGGDDSGSGPSMDDDDDVADDPDDGESTMTAVGTDGDPSDGSDGAVPLSCMDGMGCVPPAPEGWVGPGALIVDGPDLPACPSAIQTELIVAHFDLQTPPATCNCNCSGVDGSCADATVRVNTMNDNCGPGTATSLSEDACTSIAAPGSPSTADFNGSSDGACAPNPSMQLPPPIWESHALLCRSPDSSGCAGEDVCLGSYGIDKHVCIAQVGNVACPEGAYSFKNVVHETFDDARGCGACSCAIAGTMCAIDLFAGAGCQNLPFATWPVDMAACIDIQPFAVAGQVSARLDGNANACSDVGGDPTGTATPAGAITYCCNM